MRFDKRIALGVVVALLPFGAAHALAAEEPAQGAIVDGSAVTAIPGSYIVALKDTAVASAQDIASRYRATVTHDYRAVFTGFAALMSEADAKALAADASVAYVEQDKKVSAFDDVGTATIRTDVEWGLDRIDQRRTALDGKYHFIDNGSGVPIYVIDSGVRVSHNEFDGPWGSNRATAPVDFVDDDGNGADCHGHGTHVAATAAGQTYGVAPAARVIGLRVLNCQGDGTDSDVIAALDHVRTQGGRPAVVNMSLGGAASVSVDNATRTLVEAGVPVVVAAGNSGADAVVTSPARVAEAITVAASDRNNKRPYWSNDGNLIDLHAPGDSIKSAAHTDNSATAVRSGTSMAAPHVTGVVARFLQRHPTRSPSTITWALQRNAVQGGITGTTPPPDGWTPGEPGTQPGDPPPTENSVPIGTTGTTALLLHASIDGQPDTTCELVKSATGGSIPDYPVGQVTKSWTISGCDGVRFWGPMSVAFDIDHPRPSDLLIDLIGPSGTHYRLREPGATGPVDEVTVWRAINQDRDGAWRFEVRDMVSGQTGYLNNVKIGF